MLWTGRGIPRKYCSSCKHLIDAYDDAALYEIGDGDSIRPSRRGHIFEDD
ncbi:hypothetical protein DESC_180087 [Desulfosarcina cetonica]|nr:hypothetical protein DESC_180087 [Desulfosarcina cetonica]